MKLKHNKLFITLRNHYRIEKNKLKYFKEINIFDSDSNTDKYINRIVTKIDFEVTKKGNIKNYYRYRKQIVDITVYDGKYEHKENYFEISKDELSNLYKYFLNKVKNTFFEISYNNENFLTLKETQKEKAIKAIDINQYLGYNNNYIDFIFN